MHFIRKLICALLLVSLPAFACAELEVHFLNVGQGDAALVICDGEAMLIDGGSPAASQLIYTYLHDKVSELKYMIATHPHEDHVGGCAAALNAVPVSLILSPVTEWDTRAFNSMVKYANAQGTEIVVPMEGDVYSLGSSDVMIIHCWPEAWTPNDMSIVVRVDYGSTSFLFTGDAEAMSEYMMVDSDFPLGADVLKLAHHGSRYSSTQEFLDAVDPQYAVISCGKNNTYGHPHQEVLERLNEDVVVLRTDELGTIIMSSDGDTILYTNVK